MKVKVIRFLSAVMVLLLCTPVFASSGSQYEQKIGFWDWLTDKNSILPDFIGYMAGTICPTSADGYHHSNSYQIDQQNGYYTCICSYCGRKFEAYESDLQQSYNDYVGTLPATGWNSAGHLIWQPTVDDACNLESFYLTLNFSSLMSGGDGGRVSTLLSGRNGFHLELFSNLGVLADRYTYNFYFTLPIDGSYRCIASCMYSGSATTNDGVVSLYYEYMADSSLKHYFASDSLFLTSGNFGTRFVTTSGVSLSSSSYTSVNFYFPMYEVVPDTALSGDQYNITTCPTTITGGNYGIVGDNGQITKIEDNRTIINETNNTYYNPATGQTGTINNWSYDYSDRSYNITLESGDTITVTYGDQNITIVEGGDTYIIYYIIDGSGSGSDPGPSPSPDPKPSDSPEPSLPPSADDPDDLDDGGLLEWINSLIKYLSDHLSGAVDLILSFFRKIPELFGGFLDFLSAMFPYLPDDIIFLLTFGIAAVVIIGIIKAIRR